MKEGWTYKTLGEVATIIGGSTPKSNIEEYWGGSHYWVTPADLKGNKYQGATPRTITDLAIQKTNLQLLPKGTVLLSSRAPIGKVAITTVPMYCNQGFKNIVCSEQLLNEFVYWYLLNKTDYLNSLGRGATFKEISKKATEQIPIPVPPLSEQQRIVSELDLLSSIIEKKKAQLKEYDQLAQSIFYDMFGDPVTNEKGWEVVVFSNVCETVTDFVAAGSFADLRKNVEYNDAPDYAQLIRTVDLKNGFLKKAFVYVNKHAFDYLWRVNLDKDAIILPNVGVNCGEVYYIKPSMLPYKYNVLGPNAILVRSNHENLIYLSYYFRSPYFQSQIETITNAVGQPKFNKTELKKLLVCLPPLTLQQSFASKIEAIERQKALIQKTITEAETLFNSRMDYYFN